MSKFIFWTRVLACEPLLPPGTCPVLLCRSTPREHAPQGLPAGLGPLARDGGDGHARQLGGVRHGYPHMRKVQQERRGGLPVRRSTPHDDRPEQGKVEVYGGLVCGAAVVVGMGSCCPVGGALGDIGCKHVKDVF